ncbi:GNAT family N-acetyltransferase [Patulibacter sp.]|uniref:GNAT family N-acetyltransferase n=1 Tax=Patulibacter sp. TaxID=1912859 RepID=UPI0027213467|nr:GNAT family N-acetyltransferase [Patulibacter sp.]MDO9407733.1 GNAT family N-acetyltransferase [Patulibacter sp.]
MSETRNDEQANRYEIVEDGVVAGFAEYALVRGERIVFTHTEIDPAFEGRGLGSTLIGFALEDARAKEQVIVPICPFVAKYVHRHPEYVPFLDERIRKAFE